MVLVIAFPQPREGAYDILDVIVVIRRKVNAALHGRILSRSFLHVHTNGPRQGGKQWHCAFL